MNDTWGKDTAAGRADEGSAQAAAYGRADAAPAARAHATLTRREFARAGVLGGAALFALGGLFGCAPSQGAGADPSETIDCDVLVVGGGGAGVTAAGQAADAGAKTVLIEKMDHLAGSSSLALGTFYGAGTSLQKAAGIEDDPEGLLRYFLSRGGDKLDYEMQEFCAYHFGETIDWLVDELQVPFKEKVSKKGTDTVARGHNCANAAIDALRAVTSYAAERGVSFHFNTEARSLIMEDGAVAGVIATTSTGKTVAYRAKRTIMASGGFCRNQDMIEQYCPDYAGVYTEVGPGCTGEGLRMGLDVGADYLGHGGTNGILACSVQAGQSPLIDKKAMWVDSSGRRFINEDGQTHDIYYQVAHFPDQSFFAVYDQAMVDALSDEERPFFEFGLERGVFAQGDTPEQAAEALGIDGAALADELAAYNAAAAAGVDAAFGKKADNLKAIDRAPFYVLTLGVCTHGSFGGYRVNTRFEVLDTQGEPIPSFYAVGEVSCGTFIYDDYPAGGCGLNYSYTSGRFAGRNAAESIASA